MKYIFGFIIITVGGYFAQINLPYWWIGLVVAGLVGLILGSKSWASFWMGFVGIFLLWAGYAHYIDYYNHGMLSNQMGDLFGGLNGLMMALVTGLIGAILGGLAAMTGSLARQLFIPNKPKAA